MNFIPGVGRSEPSPDAQRAGRKIFISGVLGMLLFWVLLWQPSPCAAKADPNRPAPEKLVEILASFESYAEKAMRDWGVPGMAVAVVQDGNIIYKKGFGVKRAGDTAPVTENTVFQIGSASKAFAAALVGILADEKKLGWNDRVIDHLPWFRLYDPWVTREFTITDIMAHRSGLPGHALDGTAVVGFDRARIMNVLRFVKPAGSFRGEYAYQNALYLVAGTLPEKYWGFSWEDALREKLFKPLGMTSSSATAAEFVNSADCTFLHKRGKDNKLTAYRADEQVFDCYTMGAAGGINSNAVDMARWITLHLQMGKIGESRILSEESMTHILTPKTVIGSKSVSRNIYYAQGWLYMEHSPYPVIWHNGDTGGCHSMVAFVPDAGVGIVVLANTGSLIKLPDALAFKFLDMYFARPEVDRCAEAKTDYEANLPKPPKAPDNPLPPLSPGSYTGTFKNEVYGPLTVTEKEGKLAMTFGPGKLEISLKHWDRDLFRGIYPGPDEQDFPVSFRIDPNGKAVAVTLEDFNEDGCGIFERAAE